MPFTATSLNTKRFSLTASVLMFCRPTPRRLTSPPTKTDSGLARNRQNQPAKFASRCSAAFGWQASSDQNTLAVQIELSLNRLKNADDKFEVINLAVPTGNSFIDRSIVYGYAGPYEIDALVFVTGSNDLNGSVRNVETVVEFASDYLNRSGDLPYLVKLWSTLSQTLILRAANRVHVFNFVMTKLLADDKTDPWVGERDEDGDSNRQKFISEYMTNMEAIYQYAQRLHIPVLVIHQPRLKSTLHNLASKLVDPADRAALDELKNTTDPELKLTAAGVPEIVELGEKISRKYGIRYLDGNEAFRNYQPKGKLKQGPLVDPDPDGPLFISSSHFAPAGTRILADYAARKIVELNIVGP